MKTFYKSLEGLEQIAYLQWLQLQYPFVYRCTFHIANERKTSPQYGRYLKMLGVKAGVSDLFIAYPSGEYHGMFIEMKSRTGKPSPIQIEFLDLMRTQGYYSIICYGADEAIAVTKQYLN